MGKSSKPSAAAASGSKKMKGLVEAAALMAGGSGTSKVLSSQDIELASYSAAAAKMPMPTLNSAPSTSDEKTQAKDANAARTRRLEQNRRAAIESRRRKKVMIAELQKSVAFYTKANESINLDNLDLEQKLLLAKRSILQMKAGTFSSTLSLEQGSVAPSSIEFITKVDQPSIAPVLAPVRTDQILAQLSATQALCDSLETKSIASEVVAPIMPSGEDVGSEEYVESLKKFAMHQAAAASAAAAAANAAIQALNWHNIMKVQHSPSVPVLPASATQEGGESPPAKKQKSL